MKYALTQKGNLLVRNARRTGGILPNHIYMLTMIAENKNAKTDFQLAHIAYLDNELNYLLKNKYIYEL